MEKAMRYEVIRESIGISRTHKDFKSEEAAVDWANRHSTRAHIICSVYAVEVAILDDGKEKWPCSPNVRSVAYDHRTENVGTLIYYKRGNDIKDLRKEEAPADEYELDDDLELLASSEDAGIITPRAEDITAKPNVDDHLPKEMEDQVVRDIVRWKDDCGGAFLLQIMIGHYSRASHQLGQIVATRFMHFRSIVEMQKFNQACANGLQSRYQFSSFYWNKDNWLHPSEAMDEAYQQLVELHPRRRGPYPLTVKIRDRETGGTMLRMPLFFDTTENRQLFLARYMTLLSGGPYEFNAYTGGD